MTEKTYNQIEALLKAKKIQEEPEDILLELAEHLADAPYPPPASAPPPTRIPRRSPS